MLERWSSDAPGAIVGGVPVEAAFQTLARGIENLQVQYLRADGDPDDPADWSDAAPLVVPGDYAHLDHAGPGHAGRAQRGAEHRRGDDAP